MSDSWSGMSADQHFETAELLYGQGKFAEAEPHYRAVLEIRRDEPAALQQLGLLCAQSGRIEEAAQFFERCVAAVPGNAAALNNLGAMCAALGRFEEAVYRFESALSIQPDLALALAGLGDALNALSRHDEALSVFGKLLARDPNNAAAHFGTGSAMEQMGRPKDARRAYERAVALAPKFPAYHRALAGIEPFGESDPRLAALEELAREEASFSEDQKIELHFALAKAYDDLRRYEAAFEHLQKGNAIKRRRVSYGEALDMEFSRAIAASFTSELFETRRGAGDPSDVPVFVVGMPRSGTTLVEQILASHPSVFGAGELMYMYRLAESGHAGGNFPFDIASLPDDALRRFGGFYAARVRALAPQAKRIVDKLPANFRLVGLIRLALPNARIIHVRRDPLDTCFSCYSKLFSQNLDFTYDLGELGRYYKAYDKLMEHWRNVLPEGAMLEVQYEDLVSDFEPQARRLIAYCGLEWDDGCLSFHKTVRPVRTASAGQVRQPVFKTSIGRWRPYREHLRPLLDALGVSPD